MPNQITVEQNVSTLTTTNEVWNVTIVNPEEQNITVVQAVPNIITIATPGPQGPQGPAGVIPTSGSYSGSFTGTLYGTSSWSENSANALYAITSSLPLQGIINATVTDSTITFYKGDGTIFNILVAQSGSIASASYALYATTSSYSFLALTASYVKLAESASVSDYAITSSYSHYADSASVANYATTSSYATQADSASISNYAITSSLPLRGVITGSISGTTLTLTTGDETFFNLEIASSSYAFTASYALNAGVSDPFPYTGSAIISGSLIVTGSTSITGPEGSILFNADADTLIFTGSIYSLGPVQITGSVQVLGGVTASLLGTASYALTASYIDGGFY